MGFQNNSINCDNIVKSSSNYRFKHLTKLVEQTAGMTVQNAVSILRNQKGMNEENIGMGNEKALNQLIAHHSVVFKPAKLQMWISTNPFQLGQFVCYDLNKVFAEAPLMKTKKELYEKELTIPADRFIYSLAFRKFNAYKLMREAFQIKHKQELNFEVDSKIITTFISLNPEYFETYYILGNYYSDQDNLAEAMKYYSLALTKEITTVQDKEAVEKCILDIQTNNR
jgi:tetratricopeptide (TPR) repeat protein